MKSFWYALLLAGSIGLTSDSFARGSGHFHGFHGGGWGRHHHHHASGGGYYRGYGGRSRFGAGFYFGIPFGYRNYPYYTYPYYGYPYYPYYRYPPAVVTIPTQPPVYIEKQPKPTVSRNAENYWYYCTEPPGYYPYVKACDREWQPVPTRPPAPQ